jgi:F420-dependent oxidoreductase-like protein
MVASDEIRVGVHAGQQDITYAEFADLWRRAETLGFDWISHHDHFVPLLSDPVGPCFDGLTLLAAMAAQTQRVQCGLIVLGITYRHPAIVANMAATLDHISGGRLTLGLGAAWYEEEHAAYGIPFPSLPDRMDMLDEACTVLRSLWTNETTTFEGRHFQLRDARMAPKPVQKRLPLAIGGSGERRTLRIVAAHADLWNTHLSSEDGYRHKLDVLARHCADVGRDPSEIRKSLTFRAVLAATEKEARNRAAALDNESLERAAGQLRPDLAEFIRRMTFVGTPERCVDWLRPFAELGVGDFLLHSTPPLDPETIELVAREVAPALRG